MKIFILLSFVTAAFAQTNSSTGVVGGIISTAPGSGQMIAAWNFSGGGPGMPGGTVVGMPYSAEEITEQVQTLVDGTRITQPSPKVKFYRDSLGRTRTERSFPLPVRALPDGTTTARVNGPDLIEISDPVAGVRYTLDARSHTAHQWSVPNGSVPTGSVPNAPPPPPSSTMMPARRVAILPAPAGIVTPAGRVGPNGQTPGPQISREPLGMQTIEGVAAEGSRMTVVFPVGAFGNDRPVTTVSETWMSPELKTVVLSKSSDPRRGESTMRLTNISRAEPDPSLFQIPVDYQVAEAPTAVPKAVIPIR